MPHSAAKIKVFSYFNAVLELFVYGWDIPVIDVNY